MTLTRLKELLRAWVIAQGYRIVKNKKWLKQFRQDHEATPISDEVAVGSNNDNGFCLFAVRNNVWNSEVDGQEVDSYQVHIVHSGYNDKVFVYLKDGAFVTIE